MRPARHTIVIGTCALALATFAFVQDRVTAAGARRYAAMQRTAIGRNSPGPTIEEVMAPAIRSSVRWGGLGAAVVLTAGLGLALRRGKPKLDVD